MTEKTTITDAPPAVREKIESAIEKITKRGARISYVAISRESGLPYSQVYDAVQIDKPDIYSRILPALDGQKTVGQIAQELKATKQVISRALVRMENRGQAEKIDGKWIKC